MASTKRSDGEGSVHFDRGRDRWVGVLVIGWREGKPVRRKVSAKTKADATRRLRELREKHEAGALPTGRVPTVGEWLTYWIDEVAPRKIRPTTLPGYQRYVRGYLIPLLGHHRIDRLRPEHIERAWTSLQTDGRPGAENAKPLSGTTVLQAHRILSRALKVAHQRGHVRSNVATLVQAPTPENKEMLLLTLEEARLILSTTSDARWSVALGLGLRQGEALGLRWRDVDLEAQVLHVRQSLARLPGQGLVFGKPKSRAGRRSIGIPDQLIGELREHRAAWDDMRERAGNKWQDHDLLFCRPDGTPIDPRADWGRWRDMLAELEIDHRRLHDARHTAATLLLAQGVPARVVMDILGHSQISQTARYQHVLDPMHREAANRQGAALWG